MIGGIDQEGTLNLAEQYDKDGRLVQKLLNLPSPRLELETFVMQRAAYISNIIRYFKTVSLGFGDVQLYTVWYNVVQSTM